MLGYDTHIHFGKVESMPHDVKFWNGNRVLILYLMPPLVFLFISIFLLGGLLYGRQTVNGWRWFRFWFMVFSVLLSTTLMTLSLFSVFTTKGSLFQGFSVVCYWYGLPLICPIILIILSGVINFGLGFLCAPVLLHLAPEDSAKEWKKRPSRVVLYSFILPVAALFFLALVLSFPGYCLFFDVLFVHACLWLPGLFTASTASLRDRRSSTRTIKPELNYLMAGITLVFVVLIRIFF